MRMWWRCHCRWWERVAHAEQGMHSKPAAIERVWESCRRGNGDGELWENGQVVECIHTLTCNSLWVNQIAGSRIAASTTTWTRTSATSAPRSGPCELCAINLASFGGQLVTQCETPAADASRHTHTHIHRKRDTQKPRHTPILSPRTPKMKECGQKEDEEKKEAGK